jgi:hypothetical protein
MMNGNREVLEQGNALLFLFAAKHARKSSA